MPAPRGVYAAAHGVRGTSRTTTTELTIEGNPVTHPIGMIKDLTLGAIKTPAAVAGHATRTAAGLAVRVVDRIVPGPDLPLPDQRRQPTPVNVTEELGLDPAPVAERPEDRPLTSIDRAADPDAVEATPADIAGSVAKKRPTARKASTRKTAPKAPASAPGDKLPAR